MTRDRPHFFGMLTRFLIGPDQIYFVFRQNDHLIGTVFAFFFRGQELSTCFTVSKSRYLSSIFPSLITVSCFCVYLFALVHSIYYSFTYLQVVIHSVPRSF